MIPQNNRLGRRRILAPILIHTTQLTLALAKNDGQRNRIRIVVGKKRIKHAVVRNQIRREIARCLSPLLTTQEHAYDMIFTYKGSGETENLCMQVEGVLKKGNIRV